MDLPKVEGTQVRGRIYHLNLRIKPEIQDLYGGKSHLRGSLRTSDPKAARREVRRRKAELQEREQERARQAEVEDLVAQLSPEQRAAYDAAGGLEGLLDGFGREQRGADAAPGDGAQTPFHVDVPAPPHRPAHPAPGHIDPEPNEDAGADAEPIGDDWPLGATLAVVSEETEEYEDYGDYEENLFTLADLFEEFAPNLDPQGVEAMRQSVRLFSEFHGDIAYDELTITHLDEFAVASHGLPADMMAKLADGTYVRDLPFAEMIAWTVHTEAKPISETTRFQYVAILKELMTFGVPRYRRGDPWSDYRLQIIRRETVEEPPRKTPSRFAPSEWTLSGAMMRLLELAILVFIGLVLYLLWQARS